MQCNQKNAMSNPMMADSRKNAKPKGERVPLVKPLVKEFSFN